MDDDDDQLSFRKVAAGKLSRIIVLPFVLQTRE